jgi:hypothetical protein
MNINNKKVILISVLLLILITIISIILLMVDFHDRTKFKIEGFLGCKNHKGNISSLSSKRDKYDNTTNNNRLLEFKRGPIPNFHKQFTGGLIPELSWRTNLEKDVNNLENVTSINGDMIQPINPINNVYISVNY